MRFARFMATGTGRGIRIGAGAAVIAIGLLRVRGVRGTLLTLVGLVLLLVKGSEVRVPADGPAGMLLDTSVR